MKRFWNERRGATAIEYGLIAALIAVASMTAMQSLGSKLSATFTTVTTSMTAS
ncbi:MULTISPECIES: Flp family type IVb pilin [unclassified Sphingomonas]|uniref:Flp family type IVb pilin n=1 Tax=unclassified Sphingomonas TaxID=196159 RepID=UPI001F5841C8|nr:MULTISPECIES: Flp family type IVb pilin [unclassified Sphingomonas]